MKATELTAEDAMVFDNEGTVWVHVADEWRYVTDTGELSFDAPQGDDAGYPPACYEPYILVSAAVAAMVRKGIRR